MYEQGHGSTSYVANLALEGREQLTWTPVRDIVDALDKAFYLAFKVCTVLLFCVHLKISFMELIICFHLKMANVVLNCLEFAFNNLIIFSRIYFQQPNEECSFRTGQKFFLAIDVSESMRLGACDGCPFLTPDMASFALAMVTLNTEEDCGIYAFADTLNPIHDRIRKDMKINEVLTVGREVC